MFDYAGKVAPVTGGSGMGLATAHAFARSGASAAVADIHKAAAAERQMRKQKSGAIVNCSSLGGLVGNPGHAAYHATKHGVLGLTKSAAIEYALRGININAICLGTIDTPMVSGMVQSGDLDLSAWIRSMPIARLWNSRRNCRLGPVAMQPRHRLPRRRDPACRWRLDGPVASRLQQFATSKERRSWNVLAG